MYDTVVIGAGLAGLTSARDLGHQGRSVLVLEARDRLGGRTWYRPFADTDHRVEMGGTWFAEECMPFQAAEIARYDLRVDQSPVGTVFRASLDGRLLAGSDVPVPEDERPLLDATLAMLTDRARAIRFGDGLDDESLADLDVPFTDLIEPLDLPPATFDYLLTWAGFSFGCHPHDVSAVHVLSWVAGFDNTAWTLHDAPADKLADGTGALVEALAKDGGAEIEFGSPVAHVRQAKDRVTVETRSGRSVDARTAVVATPLNTWHDMTFTPQLSEPKRSAAAEGHTGHATKSWALVTDIDPELTAFGWGGGLNWVSEQKAMDRGRLLVGIGTDPRQLDVTDRADVERAIRQFAPSATVIASDGHDWIEDEFSQGTWMAYRPGQVQRLYAALQEPEGRVFFAGSDVASGWAGFMDGALESGGTTARHVDAFLSSG